MKLARAFLLAVGIATPLWIRQQRVEREMVHWRDERDRELTQFAEDTNRNGDRLVKELNNEIRKAGRL